MFFFCLERRTLSLQRTRKGRPSGNVYAIQAITTFSNNAGTPLIHHPSHNLQQLRRQAWHQLKLNQRQPMQLPLLLTLLDSEKPITTYLIEPIRYMYCEDVDQFFVSASGELLFTCCSE